MGTIRIRADADADIDEIAQFIANDNLDAGRRFYDAIAHDLSTLAANPRMGAKREARNPRLNGLRSWPVSGFRNYLVFYIASDEGVDVLRVLHGARDLGLLVERSI